MGQHTYSVPEISCDHCKNTIEGAVHKTPGITLVEVDVATRTVRVQGDASDTSIRAAIDEAGYDVAGVAD